ncbi:MAG: CRISPR-associated RAMP protein Csx10 [Desertifilum sp.]|nr:CRISPR-associated RAMP protein Csx10 [Desertifilum sp.]
MKQIDLTITAQAPLAIGGRKPGSSVSEAENYIPGTVIRGAIASKILSQASLLNHDLSENGGDFQALFLNEQAAIFQNAYPAIYKIGETAQVTSDPIKVLPATAVSSKTDPGFQPQGHGVFDTLIDRFCADAYSHPYDPSCPEDQGRVEPIGGFYSQNSRNYYSHTVDKRLLTRVGINRRRATAEEQVLYSIEVLNETQGSNHQPTVYHSSIIVQDDSLAEQLAQFINAHPIRLGGSASRGLGKVEIEADALDFSSNVEDRIEKFNKAIEKRWKLWGMFGDPKGDFLEGKTFFSLDLQSEAILTEQWQRTTVISPEMLRDFANIVDDSLTLHITYSSYDYRSGWNTAWGLMKDVDLVTNTGGVYLFSTQNPELWYEALEKLEQKGVGDRTSEGFGQIRVCDEFHLVFRENAA